MSSSRPGTGNRRKQSSVGGGFGEYRVLSALAVVAIGAAGGVAGCGSKGAGPTESATTNAKSSVSAPQGFVRITRGAHPLALPKYDVGALDPNKHIEGLSVVFKLSPAQLADRDALIAAQTDPKSPSYRKWLTPAEYAARFGAKPEDIERTRTWLAGQGLDVRETSPLGARVTFAGDVAHLQSAFQSDMRVFKLGTETHFAMANGPAVPAELADVILGVRNTHNFFPHPMTRNVTATPLATCPTGDSHCNGHGIAPPDWKALYDVPASATGAGVTIGIVGVAEIALGDINAFRANYLPTAIPATANVTLTLVPGTGTPVASNGAGLEAILDTEWSSSLAPQANVIYYYAGNLSLNGSPNDVGDVDGAVDYAIEEDKVSILSESFGGGECGQSPSDADFVATFGSAANLLGITYLASSGDEGAAGCYGDQYTNGDLVTGLYVELPAAFPGVTAVGGTEFPYGSINYNASGFATQYSSSEQVWNETSGTRPLAGGGGVSVIFSRPTYQANIGACTPVGTLPVAENALNMREVPDVSFAAAGYAGDGLNNGIYVECTYNPSKSDCTATTGSETILALSGTSASSPAFAGVVALLGQAAGGARLGNINPMLYAINATPGGASAFHDIALGNNEAPCVKTTDTGCSANNTYGYVAAAGYDCASGLGSLDVANMLTAWASLAPTSTTVVAAPAATTLNTPVTLTAQVEKADANALAGVVTFTFQTYLSNGEFDETWTLGTAAPDSTGTASISAVIPPGLVTPGQEQAVDVIAMYGGDAQHLSSTSAKFHVTFPPLGFCLEPAVATIATGQSIQFGSAGGVAPVRWFINYDSTSVQTGSQSVLGTRASTINETSGFFTAGTGESGYVLIEAIDGADEEIFAEVTVGTSPGGVLPWGDDAGIPLNECPATTDAGSTTGVIPLPDAGPPVSDDAGQKTPSDDAGPPQSEDAGSTPPSTLDATAPPPPTNDDAGPPLVTDAGPIAEDGGTGKPSPSGCSCTTAVGHEDAPGGLLAGVGIVLGLVTRRRKRR